MLDITSNVWLQLGLISVVVIYLLRRWQHYHSKHAFYVRVSKQHIKRINKLKTPEAQLGFLRNVNPYIFEEMILTRLQQLGYAIKRGQRYSGDGGIDGRVTIQGKEVFIQAKRYKGYISAKDVNVFSQVCAQEKRYGLFVHTGRTGKLSKQLSPDHIDIISGERLIHLFVKPSFQPRWT